MTPFLMKSFFQLCVQVRVWKIKFWFILVHFHVPLLISNTIFWIHQLHWMQKFWNIHEKVICDFIWRNGEFWRHSMIKPFTMYHQCRWILSEFFGTFSQQAKCKSKISNVIKRDVKNYVCHSPDTFKLRHVARNLWRSTKYEKLQITLKRFDIQRVIHGKDVKSESYCQKKNKLYTKLYDCRIHWTFEIWTPLFRNFHQYLCLLHPLSPSADQCFLTLLNYIGKSLYTFALICSNGNAWYNNSLKNSRCNHNPNYIPVWPVIQVSLKHDVIRIKRCHK